MTLKEYEKRVDAIWKQVREFASDPRNSSSAVWEMAEMAKTEEMRLKRLVRQP